MPENEKKVVQAVNEDDDFFKDLLEEPKETSELTEEEKRLKNKNAEEARKRREAEAKAPKQPEAPVVETKPVEPSKKPDEVKPAEVKPQTTEAPAQDQKAQQVNKLGEQLVNFKSKYPNVDLAQLDGDKSFKRFIDGKLLGKKDFTSLYEEYVSFKAEITGQNNQQVVQNYQKKAQSSTGSPTTTANAAADVFSEDELKRIAQKLPFMSPKEAKQIEQKLNRSISYYDNKK